MDAASGVNPDQHLTACILYLHLAGLRRSLPGTGRRAIDGFGRRLLRQCDGRELLRDPTSHRNAIKPASKLLFSIQTSASVSGALSRPLVMNSACWKK